MFGGDLTFNMTTVKGSSILFLQSLPTFKGWEDPKSKKGLRNIIKRKMINIKTQIRTNIQNCLGSHETVMMMTITCLDSTVTFITSLLYFITDTHHDLTYSGFTEDASWQLVSQLANHIFTDDMDTLRSFVREAMDIHSR